jgi:hypothetical protein
MQIGISSQTCSLMGMEPPRVARRATLAIAKRESSASVAVISKNIPSVGPTDSAPGVRLLAPAV